MQAFIAKEMKKLEQMPAGKVDDPTGPSSPDDDGGDGKRDMSANGPVSPQSIVPADTSQPPNQPSSTPALPPAQTQAQRQYEQTLDQLTHEYPTLAGILIGTDYDVRGLDKIVDVIISLKDTLAKIQGSETNVGRYRELEDKYHRFWSWVRLAGKWRTYVPEPKEQEQTLANLLREYQNDELMSHAEWAAARQVMFAIVGAWQKIAKRNEVKEQWQSATLGLRTMLHVSTPKGKDPVEDWFR